MIFAENNQLKWWLFHIYVSLQKGNWVFNSIFNRGISAWFSSYRWILSLMKSINTTFPVCVRQGSSPWGWCKMTPAMVQSGWSARAGFSNWQKPHYQERRFYDIQKNQEDNQTGFLFGTWSTYEWRIFYELPYLCSFTAGWSGLNDQMGLFENCT